MLQLSCCRTKSFSISLLILGRAFSSSNCLLLSLFWRPFSHTNHVFPLAKIIPQTITPPPPICRLFSTTGSPLLDQVHHPSGPSNLKRFSSVNITFLKLTCFVNHPLAHSSLDHLCFFVSVIFFLVFADFKPILCSVLCTVRTFTSNSHFSFTFLAVSFFSRCQKPCHSPLHSPFSPLANWSFPPSLLFPLGVCLQHVFDRWFRQLQIHGDPFDAEAIFPLLPCQTNDFFWMNFTSLNLIVLPRNFRTIYAVRLSYVNIVVGVPVPQNSVQAENVHTATYTWT